MVHAVDLSPMFNVLRIATKNSLQSFWSGVDFGKLILGYNQAPAHCYKKQLAELLVWC
jgi:hypothetical protein